MNGTPSALASLVKCYNKESIKSMTQYTLFVDDSTKSRTMITLIMKVEYNLILLEVKKPFLCIY